MIFVFAKKRVSNPIDRLAYEVKESKLTKYEDLNKAKNEIDQLGIVFSRFYNEKKQRKGEKMDTESSRLHVMPEETSLNLLYCPKNQEKIQLDVEKMLD